MSSLNKSQDLADTQESFCPLRAKDINQSEGNSFFTRITELVSILNHKRTQLR